MNHCRHPDHPHCTQWVAPGDTHCASGHAQPGSTPTSFELLRGLRASRPPADAAALVPAQLHVSGYDPRAAGGRQVLRLDVRGVAAAPGQQLRLQLQSALLPHGAQQHCLAPALDGSWRPHYLEFSSRQREHGQYRIEAELTLYAGAQLLRRWVGTLLLLVPRADASLLDIQRAFLSTHKNVRVTADDASVARVQARSGAGPLDIDVRATNAGIAHLDLDAASGGKIDHAVATLAWDEDLIEVALTAALRQHPAPAARACLVNAAPESLVQRHVRLFALDECVLGRFEAHAPEADLLLCHHDADGARADGLTRRISARHAILRRGRHGFEIEDISRFGLLIDGVAARKHQPVALRLGMRIGLTASIRGVLELSVSALLPHAVLLHRVDQGAHAECFYVLAPETAPGPGLRSWATLPEASVMPLLCHHDGGFWHVDPASGQETALTAGPVSERLAQVPRLTRLSLDPYPELRHQGGAPQDIGLSPFKVSTASFQTAKI
ncbi:FHA domain-containing protein [Massilia sp. TS11]|uniref:FHA domain-containing protein n=1 Tax=Massilia sp. TS11 TaxID=2908003 RepID=UPI001EDB0F87|nr:FHA domain-containing protein [Massilia sp. TS11]MCG2584526.1 FHA domain-containing protein [Massilia sp. TS11]